ncbi:hypothetical protein BMS3Abin16_00396 [archaeon BMS3Abin16]|nr:hypothetical protein BMS3Abin16_00396 [archaeon BMS3Abin16]
MGIKDDAGEVLIYYYNVYTDETSENRIIGPKEILEITKWKPVRVSNAVKYLDDLSALKIENYSGNIDGVPHFRILGMDTLGIHMIEDEKTFKETFGFQIGVPGVFQFSWGLSEK